MIQFWIIIGMKVECTSLCYSKRSHVTWSLNRSALRFENRRREREKSLSSTTIATTSAASNVSERSTMRTRSASRTPVVALLFFTEHCARMLLQNWRFNSRGLLWKISAAYGNTKHWSYMCTYVCLRSREAFHVRNRYLSLFHTYPCIFYTV